MANYGYVRVSSADQNENRQFDAMKRLKVKDARIFVDKQSGKDFNRAAWNALMERLAPGDLLYVQSIDRMGRNYEDIQNQWRILTKVRGIDICVIDMPLLDTRIAKDLLGTVICDLILQLLSFVAESERETIKKRQAEGIASAKMRGVKFGRPSQKTPDNFGVLIALADEGVITHDVVMKQTGLKHTAFYSRLRQYRAGKLEW